MKKLYEESKIAAIAESIRMNLVRDIEWTETYTTEEMPRGIDIVADANYWWGFDDGYFEGKQAEHDAFWYAYQQNGNRTTYAYAFGGAGWNVNSFHPKYKVTLKGTTVADNMFNSFNLISYSDADDLLDFTPFNNMFDFSGCTRLQNTFQDARIKNLYCDCSSATTLTLAFAAGNGGYLENLTLKVTSKTTGFSSTFANQKFIQEIRFTEDSGIAATLTFAACEKLSKASITNIVNTLSPTASGKALTLKKTAVNNAFTTDEWTALANTKSNWTISLA